MRSAMHLAQLRLSIAACAMLGLPGCVNAPPIAATKSACSDLLPAEWRQAVPGVALPEGDTVGDWVQFGDAQTGQLDKANDRTLSSIGIVERCEKRDAAAIAAAVRPWWKFW